MGTVFTPEPQKLVGGGDVLVVGASWGPLGGHGPQLNADPSEDLTLLFSQAGGVLPGVWLCLLCDPGLRVA